MKQFGPATRRQEIRQALHAVRLYLMSHCTVETLWAGGPPARAFRFYCADPAHV